MGKNNWIAVVEIEGRRFLIATGEKGASMLTELEPAPPERVANEAEVTGLSEASGFDGIFTESDDAEGPRKGFIRRLQDSTLRRAPTSRGPQFEFDA
jgi:hypothetical protein